MPIVSEVNYGIPSRPAARHRRLNRLEMQETRLKISSKHGYHGYHGCRTWFSPLEFMALRRPSRVWPWMTCAGFESWSSYYVA